MQTTASSPQRDGYSSAPEVSAHGALRPSSVKLISGGDFRTLFEEKVEPLLREKQPTRRKRRARGAWVGLPGTTPTAPRAAPYAAASDRAAARKAAYAAKAQQPQPPPTPVVVVRPVIVEGALNRRAAASERVQQGPAFSTRAGGAEDLKDELRVMKEESNRMDKELRLLRKQVRCQEEDRTQERKLYEEMIRTAQGGSLTQLQRTAQRFCRDLQTLRRRLRYMEQSAAEQQQHRELVESSSRTQKLRRLQRTALESKAESEALKRTLQDTLTAQQAAERVPEAVEMEAARDEVRRVHEVMEDLTNELNAAREETARAHRRAAVVSLMLMAQKRECERSEEAVRTLACERDDAKAATQDTERRLQNAQQERDSRETELQSQLSRKEGKEVGRTEELKRLGGEIEALRKQLESRGKESDDLRRQLAFAAQKHKQLDETCARRVSELEGQLEKALAARMESGEIERLRSENERLKEELTKKAREERLARLQAEEQSAK
eukprot:TRINITY_DN5734_c0_g1_i1.p1 TRINITY_DN5734_c0_g1~~TRINITY_DN5734_c0_g1_i1.p1  ORF type:complete len:496 (+),score=130.14 TRINITY_DN5734_c0_g1_i1:135-1622(+)